MSITLNLKKIKEQLPQHVHLVAVSKTKPVEDLMEAYEAGQRIFGENKIQEMTDKWEQMPKDIQWHMIGHVQSNKVKYMAPYVSMIHGVDSLKLLIEIDRQAKKHRRIIPCLLQLHIAREETKFGLNEEELAAVLDSEELRTLENIRIWGLMGMASFTTDEEQIRAEFNYLNSVFEKYRTQELENCDFRHLSMGMSSDYKIAIECGSTIVRIGSTIFGNR